MKKPTATTLLPPSKKPIKLKRTKPGYRWEKWFSKTLRIVFLFRGRDFIGDAEAMQRRVVVEARLRAKKVTTSADGDVVAFVVLGDR